MNTFQNLDRKDANINPGYNRKQLRKRNSEKFFERKVEIDEKRNLNHSGDFDFRLKPVPSRMLEDVEDVMTVFSSASEYNRITTLGSQRADSRVRIKRYELEIQRFYTNYFMPFWMDVKSNINKILKYYEKRDFELEQSEINSLKMGLKRVRKIFSKFFLKKFFDHKKN